MPTEETKVPREVRMQVTPEWLEHMRSDTHSWGDYPSIPVRIIPYDANDPPPEWPVGMIVRVKKGAPKAGCQYKVQSDVFRWADEWCFIDEYQGKIHDCADFEPLPTKATVTLRVTGRPGRIATLAKDIMGAFDYEGLSVEVVEE